MSYDFNNLKLAKKRLEEFKLKSINNEHLRYFFPYLCGTYFVYRKIDVLRINVIAKVIKNHKKIIRYLEIGCGNGDFLNKVRTIIPNAIGIENNSDLLFLINRPKPHYIDFYDINFGLNKFYDIIFVGWMDPGQDYRDKISECTSVIITTLDQGISLAAEYEGHGFSKIAEWNTPSWEDVNIEISNRYYSNLSDYQIEFLSKLRGSHNYWYVYCKDKTYSRQIKKELIRQEELEESLIKSNKYEFEKVLDDVGFGFLEIVNNRKLWKINYPNLFP